MHKNDRSRPGAEAAPNVVSGDKSTVAPSADGSEKPRHDRPTIHGGGQSGAKETVQRVAQTVHPREQLPTGRRAGQSPADLADLDAEAEQLSGYLVVQVVINDAGHRRTHLYRSAAAAERAVERARKRGRWAHVTLCQLLPVGVVYGLGGGR